MDIASLSGAVYGVGQAILLCMGLFWAGLSLSLDSIYRSLATGHCSVQSYRHPCHTTPSPPTQQQINTTLCHHGNQLLMSPPMGGEVQLDKQLTSLKQYTNMRFSVVVSVLQLN